VDRQPLLDTYAQLQEIRTYYKFNDAESIAMCSAARTAGDAVGARAGIHAPSAKRPDLGHLHVLFSMATAS